MVDYKKELAKLYAIITQDIGAKDRFISREYVKKKLEQALSGRGIGVHPSLDPVVEKIMEKK